MSRGHPFLQPVAIAGAAVLASCAAAPKPVVRAGPETVKPFDLMPRGYDDNGLPLNPELGWSFHERCNAPGSPQLRLNDPAKCSWRFIADGSQLATSRPPCNSYPMDPDFSTFVLTRLAVTCSDSPLNFPGHVNWGAHYGGAATYEGWVSWEGYSGSLPLGDFDLNFVLTLPDDHVLGYGWDWIGVELDSREVSGFASPWWASLIENVQGALSEVGGQVGDPYAIVTGLLGIDAEHMSARNPSIELHPAYAMALRLESRNAGATSIERWAMFARDRGNEGLCSDWGRVHVMPLLGGAHRFRLPWKKGMSDVRLGAATTFCTSGAGSPSVTVSHDDGREGLLVTIELPPGGIVDGDLYLEWSGGGGGPPGALAAPKAPRRRAPSRELSNPDAVAQRLSVLRADPIEYKEFLARTVRPCERVPVRLERAPLPPAGTAASVCGSPLPPVSPARAGAPGEATAMGLAQPPAAAAARPAATMAPYERPKRDTRSPRERYCAERASKSAIAAKFCSQGED